MIAACFQKTIQFLRRVGLADGLILLAVLLLPWQARYLGRVGEFGGVSWEQGTASVFATEFVMLAALVAQVLRGQPTGGRETPWHFRLWALLLVYAGLSIVWAADARAAFFTWAHLLVGFALACLVWRSRLGIRTLAIAFALGNIPNALLGLWQFLAQRAFASTWLGLAEHLPTIAGASVVETGTGRFLRAYGLLPHPNLFGAFLAVALVLAVSLALTGTTLRVRRAWLIASVVFAAGLAVSFSRSAWLALFVVFFAAFARRREWSPEIRVRFRPVILTLAAVAVVLALILGSLLTTRLLGTGRLEANSVSERALSISQGIQLLWLHPEIGVGLGNFQLAAFKEAEPRLTDAYGYQPAHFVPILVAAELGLFGLLLLLGVAILWLIEAKAFRRLMTSPLASVVLLLPLVPMVAGLFDHWPLTTYAGILLTGLVFGLSLKAEEI